MKLFMFVSYDDWELKVCKDYTDAKDLFKKINGHKVDGNWHRVFEVKEVDGYEIQVKYKVTERDMFDSMG